MNKQIVQAVKSLRVLSYDDFKFAVSLARPDRPTSTGNGLYIEAFEPLESEEHFPTSSHSGQPATWTQVLGNLMWRFI